MTSDVSADRPFVGRAAEHQALVGHVAAAREGSGRVVLVSGETGIGKTRLVEEAVAACAADRVLWGRCHETEGAPAFWPWIQALRAYVRATPPDRLAREVGDDVGELARLVPAIRTQLPGAEAAAEPSSDPEAARFRLFDAITMFLRSIATRELLVVVLDDLHWADSESLLLLAFVARELRDVRLLVLGTYREEEIRQAAAAARVLGDLARASHRVTLAGLAVEDISGYAHAAYGLAPPARTLEAVHRATAGNAFFVLEVLQLLHAKGQLDASTPPAGRLDIPYGARELILRRIQPLSDVGRRMLAAAAVVGRDFEVGVLARMVEPSSVDVILRELGPAVELGVIEELADRPGTFRFAHALVQDALVDELGPDARARLHAAAAAALEAAHGDALDPLLGDIAHHYLEAVPLGTLQKAIEFATLAGQHAYGHLGYEEAAGHLERALQATRGAAVSPGIRLGLLLPLGHAQQAAGDDEGARATFIEGAQLARDLGDAYTFPHAVLSAATGAETGTVDWPLIRLLEEALAIVGPGSGRRRSMLLAQLARSLYFANATRRHAHSAEAVAIATRIGDDVARLAALRARQLALWEPGQVASRRDIGAEILPLAYTTRDAMAIADALGWRILDHLELGEMPVVHDALRRYRELAAASRLPRVRWHVTVVEATLAALAGRFRDAERLTQRAVGLLAPSRRNNVAPFFGVQLFLLYEEEGRLPELEPVVTIAAERATNLPIWRAGMTLLHLACGRSDTAQHLLAELGAAGFADLPRDGNLLGTYARLAEACALLDAPRFAEPLLPLLAPYVDAVVVLATTAGCLGSAARFAGLLAHTLGRHEEAIGYFERALATNERIGALPQLAHTQRELALTLRARGDRERASSLEAAAAATAARLGLVTLERRLAAGSEPIRPSVAPTARRTARLCREGDVWTVACGEELTHLKDTKGVIHLVELLRHPGREFHALDLGGVGDLRTGDAGEMLDADARRAYTARLHELRDELEEAESFNDVGRTARLREEMEMLTDELGRASGLGGRVRKAGSDAERARLNVTRAMRKVVRKIEADCPVLGRHLDRAVQTGLFCSYEPDPAFPIDWEL